MSCWLVAIAIILFPSLSSLVELITFRYVKCVTPGCIEANPMVIGGNIKQSKR